MAKELPFFFNKLAYEAGQHVRLRSTLQHVILLTENFERFDTFMDNYAHLSRLRYLQPNDGPWDMFHHFRSKFRRHCKTNVERLFVRNDEGIFYKIYRTEKTCPIPYYKQEYLEELLGLEREFLAFLEKLEWCPPLENRVAFKKLLKSLRARLILSVSLLGFLGRDKATNRIQEELFKKQINAYLDKMDKYILHLEKTVKFPNDRKKLCKEFFK